MPEEAICKLTQSRSQENQRGSEVKQEDTHKLKMGRGDIEVQISRNLVNLEGCDLRH